MCKSLSQQKRCSWIMEPAARLVEQQGLLTACSNIVLWKLEIALYECSIHHHLRLQYILQLQPFILWMSQEHETETRKARNIIELAQTLWSLPVVLVKKMERLDLRSFQKSKPDDKERCPASHYREQMICLMHWDHPNGSRYLLAGQVDPVDRDIIAFATQQGLYQFRGMPFTVMNISRQLAKNHARQLHDSPGCSKSDIMTA